jgi:spermidine synthase
VLAAFMAGLALGSYFLGKYGDRPINSLRIYAYLEMGIGLSALFLFFVFKSLTPLYQHVYTITGGNRLELSIFQSVIMFIILLVPTSLMGGTLPVLSSYFCKRSNFSTEYVGYLYGLNTLGACIGVLGSGLIMIGTVGENITLFAGVFLNIFISLIAYFVSTHHSVYSRMKTDVHIYSDKHTTTKMEISRYDKSTRNLVLIVYALSGFIALSYEVLWTRIFQIQVGTSIYAFSIMLSFFLVGIAIGSFYGTKLLSKTNNALFLFGVCQLFISIYSIVGIYIFILFDPMTYEISLSLSNALLMPFLIIFPITFVFGLMFPAVSKVFINSEQEVGSDVGRLYSANTIGCILGSLVCGFVMIQTFGTHTSIIVLSGLNFFIGVAVICKPIRRIVNAKIAFLLSGVLILIIVLGSYMPDPFLNAARRSISKKYKQLSSSVEIFFHKEAVAATTTALGIDDIVYSKRLLVNGISVTAPCVETKLMAHIPIALHPNPTKFLIVCFGMGTTLRSAWVHKALQCDVVDIVPEVFETFKLFHSDGLKILRDPRVHHYIDDGRNFLLMRPQKYDIITMDPSPPIWSAGTVNLYTLEFFNLCKRRLNQDGIMCMWIPSGEFTEVNMIISTFLKAFPNSYVFGGPYDPGMYMIGFKNDQKSEIRQYAQNNDLRAILDDLNEWDNLFTTVPSMLNFLIMDPDQLNVLLKEMPIITDNHPYTEFPLWRSLFDKHYKIRLNAKLLAAIRDKMFISVR